MTTQQQSAAAQFGPNQWLVDELYQQYLADPDAVDPAWHGFFEDYRPGDGTGGPSTVPVPACRSWRGPPRTCSPSATAPPAPPALPRPDAADRADHASPKTSTPSSAARRRGVVTNMDAVAHGPDRDERPHDPGEADDRQPHRHQQPPVRAPAAARSLHPPDRLGPDPGRSRRSRPERLLRRGRRQAGRRPPRAHQPRHRDRPRRSPTAPVRSWCRPSSAPRR